MGYEEFDVADKEHSDRLADLLRAAGIRFEQRAATDARRRAAYVISVHPEDLGRANEVHAEATRRENEAFVRTLRFVRRPYSDQDMLLTLQPNDAGWLLCLLCLPRRAVRSDAVSRGPGRLGPRALLPLLGEGAAGRGVVGNASGQFRG